MSSSPPEVDDLTHDDGDTSSSEDGREPNWEMLQETLGAGALEALKTHLASPAESNEEATLINEGMPSQSSQPREIPLPKSNADYGKKSYWEDRFTKEEEFEWLVSYADVAQQIAPFLQPQHRILLVGCGNSSFSADLYDAGYTNVCSLDYSETVIDAMKKKNAESRPEMEWVVMDMTDMSAIPDESYDVVIDKAAMDALMVDEGDVWNPDACVVDKARRMCLHISRILKKDGHHLHISFAQPHFRRKYLLGRHPASGGNYDNEPTTINQLDDYSKEFGWDIRVETIAGDASDGCFHHFLYIMQKQS